MDATGDEDLSVQKSGGQLIIELWHSIPRYLWKSKVARDGTETDVRVRLLVRQNKTDQLIKLLEPFQEAPQLLDPHLSKLVDLFTTAFTAYLLNHAKAYYTSSKSQPSPGVMPLPRGICKLLYTLCKIRGQKVISHLLKNEAKFIEPMIDALEQWSLYEPSASADNLGNHGFMAWEERYIMLLWLSHLMLTPFDLDSVASDSVGHSGDIYFPTELPHNTPPIARRLVNLTGSYLASVSKERDAAVDLLVRLVLRNDMLRIPLHTGIIAGFVSALDGTQLLSQPISLQGVISILSFLAKFIGSAQFILVRPLFDVMRGLLEAIRLGLSPSSEISVNSPLARMAMIKVNLALALASHKMITSSISDDANLAEISLENVLLYLFEALKDKETSVRIAASKALSVIAVRIGPDRASVIAEELLSDLAHDTRGLGNPKRAEDLPPDNPFSRGAEELFTLPNLDVDSELHFQVLGVLESYEIDFDSANATNWHGLILTLAQLVFRGSMPLHLTHQAIRSFSRALRFEQRTALGASIGANVRDAACFGFWSLARRHTTAELTDRQHFDHGQYKEWPLQGMANDLVVAASLDPVGNIRRGASAALQEMVGRHPNTIRHAIELIQIIDYHAIALRSSAMTIVAIRVSNLDVNYQRNVLKGFLGWRACGSQDVPSRRKAAEGMGLLAASCVPGNASITAECLYRCLLGTPMRQVDHRHGLLLACAEVVLALRDVESELIKTRLKLAQVWDERNVSRMPVNGHTNELLRYKYRNLMKLDPHDLQQLPDFDAAQFENVRHLIVAIEHDMGTALRSDVICEAACWLISSLAYTWSLPLIRKAGFITHEDCCLEIVEFSLQRTNSAHAASEAAYNLFPHIDPKIREQLAIKWSNHLHANTTSKPGIVAALGALFPHMHGDESRSSRPVGTPLSDLDSRIVDILLDKTQKENTIELRCCALNTLKQRLLPVWSERIITDVEHLTTKLFDCLYACLSDYTIDQRGDIGSLVRLEAIDVVDAILEKNLLREEMRLSLARRLCGLAAEKLDRIRLRAFNALQSNWALFGDEDRPFHSINDIGQASNAFYFQHLLTHCVRANCLREVLTGYVTSATGSESVLQASRAAFVTWMEHQLYPFEHLSRTITLSTALIELGHDKNRLAVPTMNFLVFLFEAGLISILVQVSDQTPLWSQCFSVVQKAHYHSNDIPKIESAVRIYASLASIPKMRKKAMTKLGQMLWHAYPRVRNAAADALFIITQDERMLDVNWAKPPKEVKPIAAMLMEEWCI